jgi:hypothetical protein
VFGSQALETGIGLALLLFVVSTAASAVVEAVGRVFSRRAVHLEQSLRGMLGGDFGAFTETSVYRAVRGATGRRITLTGRPPTRPSYLSATAFADAVVEVLETPDGALRPLDSLPEPLRGRLRQLTREAHGDLLAVKSGLERWFDETMKQAEGAYKRWATTLLFVVGLTIAAAGNVSTVHAAQQLWQDPVTRQAVVEAAGRTTQSTEPPDLSSLAATTEELTELRLPVGYASCDDCFRWTAPDAGVWAATFAGWLLTAVLVMLGGPFWFDLLGKLVSLRTAGTRPPLAADDPGSATRTRAGAVLPAASEPDPDPDAALARALGLARVSGTPPTGG